MTQSAKSSGGVAAKVATAAKLPSYPQRPKDVTSVAASALSQKSGGGKKKAK